MNDKSPDERKVRKELHRLAGKLDLLTAKGESVLAPQPDHEAKHEMSAAVQAAERGLVRHVEWQLWGYVGIFLSGYAGTRALEDLASLLVVVAMGGAVGAGMTWAVTSIFRRRHWNRWLAYATALLLFVGGALPPIIVAGGALGPHVARLLSDIPRKR